MSAGGSCLASSKEAPASRGEEMRCLLTGMMATMLATKREEGDCDVEMNNGL